MHAFCSPILTFACADVTAMAAGIADSFAQTAGRDAASGAHTTNEEVVHLDDFGATGTRPNVVDATALKTEARIPRLPICDRREQTLQDIKSLLCVRIALMLLGNFLITFH